MSASPRRSAYRLAVHAAYFGFAVAALSALCLLVPRQTSRGPVILIAAFVPWAAATAARFLRARGDPAALSLEPAQLLVPVLLATYTVFAFDASPEVTAFVPSSPDSLPGLHIDQHAYFVLVMAGLAIFAGWHGTQRERLIETLLVAQVVLISVMYERSLAGPAAVPPLVLLAGGLLLLRFLPLDAPAPPVEQAMLWAVGPLLLFVAVAMLAGAAGAYPAAGLSAAGKMLSLAIMAALLFDTVRDERQRWLTWIAVAAPGVAEGALITLKVLFIAREMGAWYAFGNRIEMAAGVEVNPLGLSLVLSILLLAGAIPHLRQAALRCAAAAALLVLLPALVVTYSVGSLLGLGCGLVALAVVEAMRPREAGARPLARLAPVALCAAIGLVVAAAYVVPAPTRNGLRWTVDDPTTGRSRPNLWDWALRDFRANPVLGSGPTVYWQRVRYVPDFPFREVTRMMERRRLLGQDTTQWRFLAITHPHDLVVDILEGMGVLGLLAFIVGVAAAAWAAVRALRERARPDRWLTGAGLSALVAVAVWATSSIGVQVTLLPLPAFTALGIVGIAHRRPDGAPLALPTWLGAPAVRVAGAIIFVAAMLFLVVRPVGSLAAIARSDARAEVGDTAGATSALRVAAAFDPLDIGVRALLANAALRDGRYGDALSYQHDVDDRAPGNGAVLVGLGQTSWLISASATSSGDTVAAERYFRDAIRDDAWQVLNADPYTPLGLLLLTRGDTASAKAAIAAGLRVSPVNVRDAAWVHTDSGLVLDAAYTSSDAMALTEALRRRLQLTSAPATPGSIRLADVLALVEDEGRAARADDPVRAAEILDQAALAYQFAGQHADAARVLAEAVAADPGASYARYDLAQSDVALNDDAAATAQLEEVVRIARAGSAYDVRIGFAERDLALIAMRARRFDDSVRLMRQALDDYRWAYLPQAYPTLNAAYLQLGQPAQAAKWQAREDFLYGR